MGTNVETIKERLDIVDVLSTYLKIEKSGSNFKTRCPFHTEKTPSFYISPTRQSYYCFGCGAKGDIFTFIEEVEGMDFRGALKFLADKAGVELEYEKGAAQIKTEKDKLYQCLDDATMFFEQELEKNKQALAYLSSRGINTQSIKLWKLGFAPEEWRALYGHLTSLGYDKALIVKAGLSKYSEDSKTNDPYDVFRGRITFPLCDSVGRVIAFSGRALDKDTQPARPHDSSGAGGPKYLNSPDTVLFTKSEVLYGLDKAKEEVRKKDFAVLVEGQMDLVLSHQAGVKNAVASSGTAFTNAHLERLKKLSPRIILAFDGDSAGQKAAEKSAILGLYLGMEVKIAELPTGKDPADLVRESGEAWKNVLRDSLPAIEHFLKKISVDEKDHRKRGKLVEKKILPLITLLRSAIERSHFITLTSRETGIREEILWEDLRRTKVPMIIESTQVEPKESSEERIVLPRKTSLEKKIMGVIFWQENLSMPTIDTAALREEVTKKLGAEYLKNLEEQFLLDKEALIFEAENYYGDPSRLPKDITELLLNLDDDLLRQRLGALLTKLSQAESLKDEESVSRLTVEVSRLHEERRALEERKKSV